MAGWLSDWAADAFCRSDRAGARRGRARLLARAALRLASCGGNDAARPSPRGLLVIARRLPENGPIENTPRPPVGRKIAACPSLAPARLRHSSLGRADRHGLIPRVQTDMG